MMPYLGHLTSKNFPIDNKGTHGAPGLIDAASECHEYVRFAFQYIFLDH